MKKLPITSWLLEDRPREKLIEKGKESLSDSELLAILLGSGNREESAVSLAHRILKSVDGKIHELARFPMERLMEFKGVGQAKALTIITALEFGKRRQMEMKIDKEKITSSTDVFQIMHPLLGDLQHEEFWVLFLNNSNKVLSKYQLSKGGLTATLVDTRLLLKRGLELLAVAIIICHNHPSGKLEPSRADIELTKKIKNACHSVDIKLLDHLIITEKTYFSFADENQL
jgi:DNA repair protein RadC